MFVPVDSAEIVRTAMTDAGAGRIGDYDSCTWTAAGEGRFRPLDGASPAIGAVGDPEVVELLQAAARKATRQGAVDSAVAYLRRALEEPPAAELRPGQVAQDSLPPYAELDRVLEEYLRLAAVRRDELTALVTVAAPLTEQQHARLASALEAHYGKPVTLQLVEDPAVMGGIRIQVGDEVVDGTVLRRLEEARRHVTGG